MRKETVWVHVSICSVCYSELEHGATAYIDDDEDWVCADCGE